MTMEELMEQHLALQETLKSKEAEIETLNTFKSDFEAKKGEYETEIGRLKETNMNLFLKVSQQVEETPTTQDIVTNKKEQPVQSWDNFMKDW